MLEFSPCSVDILRAQSCWVDVDFADTLEVLDGERIRVVNDRLVKLLVGNWLRRADIPQLELNNFLAPVVAIMALRASFGSRIIEQTFSCAQSTI